MDVLRLGGHQVCFFADAGGGDGLKRLLFLHRVGDHSAAGLDDARLFGGYLFHRAAQQLGVVQVDAGDGRHQGVLHCVGGVEAAAEAGLQHGNVALLLVEPAEGHAVTASNCTGASASVSAAERTFAASRSSVSGGIIRPSIWNRSQKPTT